MELFIILIVIWFCLYLVFYKPHGVKQRVKVYGLFYYIETIVFIKGKRFHSWDDVADTQKEMKEAKESRRKQAQILFDHKFCLIQLLKELKK